jgi:hypothetical membrane protein
MVLWCKSEILTGSRALGLLILLLVITSYGFYFTYHVVGFAFAELFGGYSIIFWATVFRREKIEKGV